MNVRDTFLRISVIFVALGAGSGVAMAQNVIADSLVCAGDSLRMVYRFEESLSAYNEALAVLQDSTATAEDSVFCGVVRDKVLLSENGRNMSGYAYTPKVVASHTFSLEDFFLYYPLKDSCWRKVPNVLDSLAGPYSQAIYAPDSSNTLYFSAPDDNGIRNIYAAALKDTVWSRPSLLNEGMTSVSDEIYPMLSNDGKSLYFASKGLYGVGGYDLYVSEWNEEENDWGIPVNMGFPYSSPADDFLLVDSEDGKYQLFASDRDCSGDSVCVYVLEQESIPVRSAIKDADMLRSLSHLKISAGIDGLGDYKDVKSEIPENVDTKRYMDKMAEVRALRDTLSSYEQSLTMLREKYTDVEAGEEKSRLADQILGLEAGFPNVQTRLDKAIKELQDIEMDFLFSGVVIDPDKLLVEAEREIIGESTGYVFSKMSFGAPLQITMEIPEPEIDYSFRIGDQALVLRDSLSKQGIVYQIQIMYTDRPAAQKDLKGLSPVFEFRTPGRNYIYRVGLFHEYKDVLPHLNTVKRLGFREAYIVGTVDGVEKSVAEVRNIENQRKESKARFFRVKVAVGQDVDPVVLASLRQQASDKDIARTEDGLIVGPFEGEDKARAFLEFVSAMGYGQAELEEINNN